MADRKASVALELKASQFKAEAAAAERSVDGLDRKVSALDRDINKIPADAAKAGAAIGVMGAEAKRTSTSVEDLSKKTTANTDATGKFVSRADELKASLKNLAAEFDRTGDPALMKKFRSDSSELAGLSKMRKEIGNLTGDIGQLGTSAEKTAPSIGTLFSGGLTSPAAIGGIALAAIPVVAAAAGAAIAAVGAAGIAAGIAGAVQQAPRISTAFNNELDKVEAAWSRGSASFIEPALKDVQMLGDALNGLPIQKTLEELSQYTEGIGAGVASAVAEIGTGIANLIHDGAPILKALGPSIADLGHSIEEALNSIGSGAKGEAEALSQILHVVGATIQATGTMIGWFGKAYDALDQFGHGVTDVVAKVAEFDPILKPISNWFGIWDDRKPAAFGSVLPGVSQSLGDVADKGNNAAQALKNLNDQMASAINQALGLENANVAVAAGFADMAKAVSGHAHSLDINSDAGRTNIGVVTDMIGKLEQQREKAIEAGGGTQQATDAANAAFGRQISQLRGLLAQLGFNKAAVDALVGSLSQIKDKTVNVKVNVRVTESGPNGQPIGGVPLKGAYAHGGIRRAAEGLIVPPRNPGTVLFGEPQTGGEAFIPLRGISQTAAMGLAQIVGNNYGFQVSRNSPSSASGPAYLIYSGPTGGLDGFFATWLAEQSRTGHLQIHAKSIVN